MSRKKAAALARDHLTDNHAAILEAYFSLHQTREPTTIGSGEILRWFGEHNRTGPSKALIRTVLAEIQAPRRKRGPPGAQHLAGRDDAPPIPRTP